MELVGLLLLLCAFAFISVLLKVVVEWIGGIAMFFLIMFLGAMAVLELFFN